MSRLPNEEYKAARQSSPRRKECYSLGMSENDALRIPSEGRSGFVRCEEKDWKTRQSVLVN